MLKDILKKKVDSKGEEARGLFVFQEAGQAIRAEKTLKKAGFKVRLMAPPPHIRTGCDLVVAFDLIEQTVMTRELEESGNPPLNIVPVSDETTSPLELCRVKDFGGYLMVRAANMKITVEKGNLKIVNISGGGCPDVPYLADRMIGKTLNECEGPAQIGFSLCAYTLNVAYEEIRHLLGGAEA
ncbi:DUF3343 domain-containing protein [bacterium]|nr:DUF3343 domain-containing protein [bacterium]